MNYEEEKKWTRTTDTKIAKRNLFSKEWGLKKQEIEGYAEWLAEWLAPIFLRKAWQYCVSREHIWNALHCPQSCLSFLTNTIHLANIPPKRCCPHQLLFYYSLVEELFNQNSSFKHNPGNYPQIFMHRCVCSANQTPKSRYLSCAENEIYGKTGQTQAWISPKTARAKKSHGIEQVQSLFCLNSYNSLVLTQDFYTRWDFPPSPKKTSLVASSTSLSLEVYF